MKEMRGSEGIWQGADIKGVLELALTSQQKICA